MKKIGLLFGSFNPIHNGHTSMAEYFLHNANIESIWFVVSPQNPFKENILDAKKRLEMVQIAIADIPNTKDCDIEFYLTKPNYTYATIKILKEIYTKKEFILMIGYDNYLSFDEWKQYEEILKNHNVFVYPRGEENMNYTKIKKNITLWKDAPIFDISSSQIREMIKNNDIEVKRFINNKVYEYIKDNNLYL